MMHTIQWISEKEFRSAPFSSFESCVSNMPANATVAFPREGDLAVIPSFCDVHVHFREPGFFYKETMATGSAAAARGGYTAVCTMPNLSPVPDSKEHLQAQLDLIEKDATVAVYPYGAITAHTSGQHDC